MLRSIAVSVLSRLVVLAVIFAFLHIYGKTSGLFNKDLLQGLEVSVASLKQINQALSNQTLSGP